MIDRSLDKCAIIFESVCTCSSVSGASLTASLAIIATRSHTCVHNGRSTQPLLLLQSCTSFLALPPGGSTMRFIFGTSVVLIRVPKKHGSAFIILLQS
jgi:hypothetical protein